ncbi:MAG: GNAT family N-acetyltransferase [Actinomycetota bacterium]|nr:GNAT family N-acetyltransferase [Actinomycetota bacterium]
MPEGTSKVMVRAVAEHDDLDVINSGNVLWKGAGQELRTVASVPAERGEAVVLVAEVSGQPVGCAVGILAPAAAFGYGMARIYVQPTARRQGAGSALFDVVCERGRNRGLAGLMVLVPDSEPAGLAAAQRRGLVDHGHHIESALALAELDPRVERREPARAAALGVSLEPLADDADEQAWRELYAFFVERLNEAPDSREGGGNMPYEVFRSFAVEPWQIYVAREAGTGRAVGVTSLMPRTDAPARLNTLFTGVHPDSRGQGLSVALKTAHACRVRDAGWNEILTQNMDGNYAILAVNRRLGFRPVGGCRDLGLAFTSS